MLKRKEDDLMNRVYAFTDESGNNGFDFDKQDISTYFIVTAIIIKEEDLHQVELEIEKIRIKYFQTGEIKSSSVGKNHVRRVKVLKEILKSNFKVFSVIVNKKKIYTDSGLMYKTSFYKFVNNLVHKELRYAFKKLTICADQVGGNEYMESFSAYVKEHEEAADLFGDRDFYFEDSKNNVLIQLADFISGTLSFVFEENKRSEEMPDYMQIINKSFIDLKEWPKDTLKYTFNENAISKDYDKQIADLCLKQAQAFIIQNNESNDLNTILQVIVLRYLCFRFINNDTRKYIPTKELINTIRYQTGETIKVHYFRSQIIAKLRDSKVIIASSQKGYKIPSKEEELYDFINHGTSVIMPMLERLRKCRDIVNMATMGDLDLFDHTEYEKLKRFFDRDII